MGKITRKRYSADFKSKVALEAIKGDQTLAELAAKYEIHHTMISQWRRQAIEGMAGIFADKTSAAGDSSETDRLHAKIGQLVVERDFLRDASVQFGLIRSKK